MTIKLSNVMKIASFFFLVFALAQILSPLKIRLYGSEWLFMYSCCILGVLLGFVGTIRKDASLLVNRVGKIAIYGNLLITVLFFPPLYVIWGGFLELILSELK